MGTARRYRKLAGLLIAARDRFACLCCVNNVKSADKPGGSGTLRGGTRCSLLLGGHR